jgi:hypothetical protein
MIRWYPAGMGDRASDHHIPARIPSPSVRFGQCFFASFPYLMSLQLLILLLGEFEVNPSAAILNGMLEHISHLKVFEAISTLDEFRNLGDVGKIKPPRKRGLKIGFEKLAMPTSDKHEVHINASHWSSLTLAFIAEFFSGRIRLGKEGVAHGADFSCQSHSRGGRSFAAHGDSTGE